MGGVGVAEWQCWQNRGGHTKVVRKMGNAESNESAAVKRQAEGFSNPMYRLLDLGVSWDHHFVLTPTLPRHNLNSTTT